MVFASEQEQLPGLIPIYGLPNNLSVCNVDCQVTKKRKLK
jgi:hypothetical protein